MFITAIQKDKGKESSSLRGFNTEIAMRKAKENVEKHYAVVGVLEELNKTLTVLEHYVPRFFKGAKDVYWSEYSSYLSFLSIFLRLLIFCFANPLTQEPSSWFCLSCLV